MEARLHMDGTGCVHHWLLAAPDGNTIAGRCKLCGARRDFPASVEGASRQGVYDEAAGLSRTVKLMPDLGLGTRLPGQTGVW